MDVTESSSSTTIPELDLFILQQPDRARVSKCIKERDRRPVDPPPVIQLHTLRKEDRERYLQSPYLFVCASLYHAEQDRPFTATAPYDALGGTLVSSLHRLKDSNHMDGGFFVFSDVTLKIEGTFRLRFSLFEMAAGATNGGDASKKVRHIASTVSRPFAAYAAKHFPGMLESTSLSRSFAEQGVRLRIRKAKRQTLPSPSRSPQYERQRHPNAYPDQHHHQLQFRISDSEQQPAPPPSQQQQQQQQQPAYAFPGGFALPSIQSLPQSVRSLPPLTGWPYPQRPPVLSPGRSPGQADAMPFTGYAGPRLPPILPPRSKSPGTPHNDM